MNQQGQDHHHHKEDTPKAKEGTNNLQVQDMDHLHHHREVDMEEPREDMVRTKAMEPHREVTEHLHQEAMVHHHHRTVMVVEEEVMVKEMDTEEVIIQDHLPEVGVDMMTGIHQEMEDTGIEGAMILEIEG